MNVSIPCAEIKLKQEVYHEQPECLYTVTSQDAAHNDDNKLVPDGVLPHMQDKWACLR